MLKSIGVENLRSFKKTTKINIKPITVFVGKNSSGKSSFLRTLPLLRQSVEANTTGPILWFGRYVDFGDFSEAVSNTANLEPICFHFDLECLLSSNISLRLRDSKNSNINLKTFITSNKLKTITHSIEISINEVEIKITSKNQQAILSIRHKNTNITKEDLTLTRTDQFIPSIAIQKKKEEPANMIRQSWLFSHDYFHDELEEFFLDEAMKVAKKFFSQRTDLEKIKSKLSRIGVVTKHDFNIILRGIFRDQKSFIKILSKDNDKIIDELYPYLIGWNLIDTTKYINRDLANIFTSVKYIAPLRATTERYYRFQDLQVDEIDHTGSNLAMLLNSLKPNEQKDFANWTKENFGFSVFVKEVGAHYAVKIVSLDDPSEYNISDMGFGYSQVLPIITSIWFETEKRKTKKGSQIIFAIEQPELHLHPEYQAKIGDIFAKVVSVAKEKGVELIIIFETHSQSIIESLGEKVEKKELDKDDLSVIVFEKNIAGDTEVSTAEFDSNGYLTNWPIGFFSGK